MNEFNLDLIQLFLIVKKRFVWIAAITVFSGVAAYVITTIFIKPVYTATATMYVYSDTDRSSQSITASEITASQQLLILIWWFSKAIRF